MQNHRILSGKITYGGEDKFKRNAAMKLITVPPKRKKIVLKDLSSSSESEEELKLSESSEECTDENENTCVACLESYYYTKKKSRVTGFSVSSVLAGCTKTVQVMQRNVISAVQKIKGKEKGKRRQNERFRWGT